MTLRDDVRAAIRTVIFDKLDPKLPTPFLEDLTDDVLEGFWTTMEEKVGTVQEKLLNDLNNARTELTHTRNRMNALVEMNAELQGANDQLRQVVASQG